MGCGRTTAVRKWLVVLALAGLAAGEAPQALAECPPFLAAAAAAYRVVLQQGEDAVRASSQDSPAGIQETVQFDLASHVCHRGPGQAYRAIGEASCLPAGEGGRVSVRYPFQLHYRKALTLEALFQAPWEPGTDGALQVEFEQESERWIPVAKREVLPQVEGRGRPAAKTDTP